MNKETRLTWDEVYSQLDNYIKFASANVSRSTTLDNYISAEDLYQEGTLLLFKCYKQYIDKDLEEFCTIFKASLWRHIRKKAARPNIIQVEIEEVYDLGYTEDNLDKLYTEYKIKQLYELLEDEPVALAILNELLNPSERTIWEMKMDKARKETVRNQGKKINVPQTSKVKMVHIRRSLGLTPKRFDTGIAKLREIAMSLFVDSECILEFK